MFSLYKHTVTIKRLLQTGDKSEYTTLDTEYKGYLTTPGSADYKNIGIDRFSGSYIFQTVKGSDIKAGDILVHNEVEYNVKAVVEVEGIRIKYLQALLEKKVNE